MGFRLFHLLLTLTVIVQPTLFCACAVEHALFCGEAQGPENCHPGNGGVVATCGSVGEAHATLCDPCRGHHDRPGCWGREHLGGGAKAHDVGVPALPAFATSAAATPLEFNGSPRSPVTAPAPPPGHDGHLPLLI